MPITANNDESPRASPGGSGCTSCTVAPGVTPWSARMAVSVGAGANAPATRMRSPATTAWTSVSSSAERASRSVS